MNQKSNEKIVPTQDYVLVKHLPPGVTEGGIIIPETTLAQLPRCEILDCGPGVTVDGVFVPVRHKVGEIVLADCRHGYNLRKGVALIRENAIVAVVEKAEPAPEVESDDPPAEDAQPKVTLQ